MRRVACCLMLAVLAAAGAWEARAACCYFSALGSDVTQPAQKAFITWDPQEYIESFTVQPKFEGNAGDFGMVIPTPSRPTLAEMPRDFFKELAVFTILKPMPMDKYKLFPRAPGGFGGGGMGGSMRRAESTVRVLEAGVVGSLEYKIVTAERADDLYQWLKENRYSYSGDEATLGTYIRKRWTFTVMRIDPKQMKRDSSGGYTGEVTPTRFTFSTRRLVYPLRITQISVPDQTEALFYVQAPFKTDLPESSSYQYTWVPMFQQALSFAVPEKITASEKEWQEDATVQMPVLARHQQTRAREMPGWQPARLEWARKLTASDIGVIEGRIKYDRRADPEAIRNLRLLRGHLKEGQWLTKFRKVFRRGEMGDDLQIVRARLGDQPDEMEYIYILPTSPP